MPTGAPGGRIFYVASDGSDTNPGSLLQPFRTVGKGLAALQAGDTLQVRGGEYVETIDFKAAKGSPNAPITLMAYPGERPVIRGLLWLSGADYWALDGISVTWLDGTSSSNHMVKMSGGTGWSIRNCEFWGAHSYAELLISGGATSFYVGYNTMHDTYPSNATNQDHLIYANNAIGGVIEHNLLYNSPNGRAIKVGSTSSNVDYPRSITIRYNTLYNNMGPSNIQFSYGANNNEAYSNIFQKPAAGQYNTTSSNLAALAANTVFNNIGWDSVGVVEPGDPGLLDGGGNRQLDPQLDIAGGTYIPQSTDAQSYGHLAP